MSCRPDCVNCRAMDLVSARIDAAIKRRDQATQDALLELMELVGCKTPEGNKMARIVVAWEVKS